MAKKAVVAVLAVLFLVGGGYTIASAATCLSWRTIGGSSMCIAWATAGVEVQITFKDGCFVTEPTEGGGSFTFGACSAEATSTGNDSIVFCQVGANVVRTTCDQNFTFTGNVSNANPATCPDHDNESATGAANENPNGAHSCTATTVLAAGTAACAAGNGNAATCCGKVGGTCLDLTPVEMNTRLDAFFGGGDWEGFGSCADGSNSCTIEQVCSINPKKITFPNSEKEYQCNTTCVGLACEPTIGAPTTTP
jgi:hypothetical protein